MELHKKIREVERVQKDQRQRNQNLGKLNRMEWRHKNLLRVKLIPLFRIREVKTFNLYYQPKDNSKVKEEMLRASREKVHYPIKKKWRQTITLLLMVKLVKNFLRLMKRAINKLIESVEMQFHLRRTRAWGTMIQAFFKVWI